MYIINVEPLPGIRPRAYSVNFENTPGDSGTTAVVLADSPGAALEKALELFPECLRASRRVDVFEIEYAEIDWETDRALVIQRKERPPKMPLNTGDARQGPKAGEPEGWQPG